MSASALPGVFSFVVLAIIALGACSSVRQGIGLTKITPDEFLTVSTAPLTVPPEVRQKMMAEIVASDGGLKWRSPDQASLDGNTVDLDRERANFADNALRYEATLRFINGQVKTMLSAITGQ